MALETVVSHLDDVSALYLIAFDRLQDTLGDVPETVVHKREIVDTKGHGDLVVLAEVLILNILLL